MKGSDREISISVTLTSEGIVTQAGMSIMRRSVSEFAYLRAYFLKSHYRFARSLSCKSLLIEVKQGNYSNAQPLILFLQNCDFLREAVASLARHLMDIRSESFPWMCLFGKFNFSNISDK